MPTDTNSPTDLLDLSGQGILITGGCGALGTAVVGTLLAHGAGIAVNDIVTSEQAASVLPAHSRVHYLPGAVGSPEDGQRLVRAAADRLGRLPDTVLCHAGIVSSHPVEDFPVAVFDHILATNVRSAFLLAQAAATAWKADGVPGQLVFTSSWVAETPWPSIAPYSASKAALNALTRSFARELAPYRIRANAIAPGIVAAGMAKRQWDTEPDYRRRAEKAIPLGRLQDLDSVGNGFLFLCSRMSEYMTGSVLVIDGGCGLYPMD